VTSTSRPDPRRDPGHGRVAPRPYSTYLTPEQYQPASRTSRASSRGSARDRHEARVRRDRQCATLGSDCILIVVSPDRRLARQKAGLLGRRRDLASTAPARRPDRRTRPATRSRQEGHRPSSSRSSARQRHPIDISIVRDVIVQKEVIAKDLADGAVGYIT
jgi:hypothetical protein